jgi:RimJ/RimL family protein N-acetyltransferase
LRVRIALTIFGGHSGGGTPLPIPNREVKPASADGTRRATSRESRSPPNYFRGPKLASGLFFSGYDRRVELRDQDLLLRPPAEADVPAVTAACQDEELVRFLPRFPSPYREEDARDWIASCNTGESRDFLIVDAAGGDLLGAIGVRLGEIGAIGYWIAKDARGRGIATRATRLLSRWALGEGGVQRLQLTTDPNNIASQRVAEKAGFTREGILRAHTAFPDGRRDSVIFSLLPTDLG